MAEIKRFPVGPFVSISPGPKATSKCATAVPAATDLTENATPSLPSAIKSGCSLHWHSAIQGKRVN